MAPNDKIEILNAGRGWIAVNKPSGMSVHNDAHSAIVLIKELLLRDKSLIAKTGWLPENFEPAPVHRLDRETSGVLLLAVRKDQATRLQKAFQEKQVEKIYRAIVRGRLDSTNDLNEWSFPLSEKSEGRKNPAGVKTLRKPCLTRFTILRVSRYFTEIEIKLETGRQHQIRRHAALAGHPVINDQRYGEPRHSALIKKIYGTERMLLHAERLRLPEDFGGISLQAELPQEFALLMTVP